MAGAPVPRKGFHMIDATPLFRLYAQYRRRALAQQDPCTVQTQQLFSLVRRAANTAFGRAHGFSQIRTIEDYQRAVPLRRYEQMWSEFWEKPFPTLLDTSWPGTVPYFAVSSGTSLAATKYIPCTKEMIQSNTKAGLDVLAHHVLNRPSSKIFGGRNFLLGGSTDLKSQAPGIWSGDLSGISVAELPWWVKPRYFPSRELALISNWEEKINRLAHESLTNDIRMISGVPTWMLLFFDTLKELHGDSEVMLSKYYPNLELIIHGGVNFQPYLHQFEKLLEGTHAELREVYPASEGFIAVADRGYAEGLRMVLDHGIFFEFVPLEELGAEQPTRHWIGNIEEGVNYAIILSTCAGLWSYIIGDTIRFIDREVPRLLITGRTSYYLSAFGEHLIEEEIEDAITFAAGELHRTVNDFSVGPLYPSEHETLGGHVFVVEVNGGPLRRAERKQFEELLDARLCQRNEDYEAHRAGGFGLRSPRVEFMQKGFFNSWMAKRGKLGGQNKVPRMILKDALLQDLLAYVEHSSLRLEGEIADGSAQG